MTMSEQAKKETIDRMAREVQADYAKVRDLVSMSIQMIAACADAGCPDDADAVQFIRELGEQHEQLRDGIATALGLSEQDLAAMGNLSERLAQLLDVQLQAIASEQTARILDDARAVCEAAGSRELPTQLRELAEGIRRRSDRTAIQAGAADVADTTSSD